jgi:hypothetical protein
MPGWLEPVSSLSTVSLDAVSLILHESAGSR